MNTFTLRFIHNADDKSRDSVLNISQKDGSYVWKYRDGDSSQCPQYMTLYSQTNVYSRLKNMLEILENDDELAANIQLEVPAYPMVIFSSNKFPQMKQVILEALCLTCNEWPNQYSIPLIPSSPDYSPCVTPKHLFFDE